MATAPAQRLDLFIANPRKALWIVSLPMMLGFSVHAIYTTIDTIFIGRLGPDALAASGYIGAIFFAAIALANGLSTGITAVVANAFGRRDISSLHHTASAGLLIGIVLGFLLGGIGLLLGPFIIPLLGAQAAAAELAWRYMVPLWLGMPFMFASTAVRSVINGEGDATSPMIIQAVSTVINLLLAPLFIFAFKMGIAGAAWATFAAQLYTFVAFFHSVLFRRKILARFQLSLMMPTREILKRIADVGIPTAAGLLVMSAGMVLLNRVVSEFGQNSVAGFVAGSRVDMLVALPLMGLAAASVTLVGMFSGAGRSDLVRETALYALRWAVLSACLFGVVLYAFSGMVTGLFIDDPHSREVGSTYLRYMIFSYPFMAIGMTSGRILQGLGYGLPSLVITSMRVLLIGVAGSYLAVYLLNGPIESIWLSMITGGAAAAALSIVWLRRYVWRDAKMCAMESA